MIVLALDPSINHLGWTYMGPGVVLEFGTINAPTEFKQMSDVERINWMVEMVNDIGQGEYDTVAIECPEPWGAYKSMASSRSGSLQILTLLTGALTQWACNEVGIENVKLIKVSQHKGQLPKHVTQKRMGKKYKCEFATSHEADAVNLGDYVLNLNSTNGR